MGKMSRTKGKVGEREVAELLRANGFHAARRGVQYQGGADSPDVIGLPGFHNEVKRTEAAR
jgi:Holliday junction resolvase